MGGATFINNSTSQNQDLTIVGGTLVGNTSGFGGAVATGELQHVCLSKLDFLVIRRIPAMHVAGLLI